MKVNFPNIINKDGQAHYFGSIFNDEQNHYYFNELLNKIEWANESIIMFGKEITTKRKVAFYADDKIEYTYSKRTKKGLPWTPLLLDILQKVTTYTECNYNACLLNLYHDGNESMGWHSDNEKEIVQNSSIASLSFGAERKFAFKHKVSNETLSMILNNGSLLEMAGALQQQWFHSLPKSKKINQARINLTFRQMIS